LLPIPSVTSLSAFERTSSTWRSDRMRSGTALLLTAGLAFLAATFRFPLTALLLRLTHSSCPRLFSQPDQTLKVAFGISVPRCCSQPAAGTDCDVAAKGS